MGVRIALKDPTLFGNDAAEDEDDAVFDSYARPRPEVETFLSAANRISIARAYKGEGKSALLRLVRARLARQNDPPLVLSLSAKQVSPSLDSEDTDLWSREWKKSILQALASEIGARIGMAWGDDAIALVEESERNGYKSRSIVSAIFDRLNSAKVPIARTRLEVPNPEKLIQRWATRSDGLWIFIDDSDENFRNIPVQRAKVSSFFGAAREMVNAIPQLRFRLAVRPNTWTTLISTYESLSKIQQYCVDLRWTEPQLRDLLAGRVRGYLVRTNQWAEFEASKKPRGVSDDDLLAEVFESPVVWNGKTKPLYSPLVTLSQQRPRWLVELSREAATLAAEERHPRITLAGVQARLAGCCKTRPKGDRHEDRAVI